MYFSEVFHGVQEIFLGENSDSTQTELKSRNINFLEQNFPSIEEVNKDAEIFEVEDELAPIF